MTRTRAGAIRIFLAWAACALFASPLLFVVQASLRSEADAVSGELLAPFTLDQWRLLLDSDATKYLLNSAIASGCSVVLVIALAFPAAYALAVRPVRGAEQLRMFILSTKFLPMVAAILPIFLLVSTAGALDQIWVLVLLYTSMNLPIAIWILCSFLLEVPAEIVEAAQLDGAGLRRILLQVIAPVALPGISATALICVIFSWNEFLFALNLTATSASTAPVFLVGFITNQGLFLARLSAAVLLVSLPVLALGLVAQGKLVRGLSLGAVK